MHQASRVLAGGADFVLLGPVRTMIRSTKPVVAIGAMRTGAGKSQTTRYLAGLLRPRGSRVVVIRHPMPYGDLVKQRVQRFATYADLDRHETTIEEREEYEPHLDAGSSCTPGVDYEAILREAEKEADVILWDGGNNDFPFYRPDLLIVVADPLRPGHEMHYHPGEANLRMADVVVINKVDSAEPGAVEQVRARHRAPQPAGRGDRGPLVAHARGRDHPGQAGRGRRGRPHPDPRRDDLRRGHRRRPALRRRGDRGPASRTRWAASP